MPWASRAGLTPDPRSPASKHVSCRRQDWLGGSGYQISSTLVSYLIRNQRSKICSPVYCCVWGEGSPGSQLVKVPKLSSGWPLAPSSPDIHSKASPEGPHSRGHSRWHCARRRATENMTTPTARTTTTTTGTARLLLLLLLVLTYLILSTGNRAQCFVCLISFYLGNLVKYSNCPHFTSKETEAKKS